MTARLALLCVLVAGSAQAAVPLYEDETVQLTLGGYTRSFTAWQKPGISNLPDGLGLPDELGLHVSIQRLELKLSITRHLTLEAHSRFSWFIASDPIDAGFGGTGLGVSRPPPRSVDVYHAFIDEPTHRFDHDLDRLTARLFFDPVEISIGRQAITWGTATLFPVADVWTTFSPFDLDTSQKRGVDALRVVWGINFETELDVVLVDRGSFDDLSGGVRASFYLDFGDVYVAAAKMWEEIAIFAGVSANVESFKLRAEAVGVYDLDDEAVQLPRVTLGVDWFISSSLVFGVEGHFNGVGTGNGDYLAAFGSDELARGERYLAGRWYGGLLMSWKPYELLTLNYTLILNASHPSAMAAWSVGWSVAQDVDLSVGGFHGLGSTVDLSAAPNLVVDDEFGAYGHQVYFEISAFF